jgi:hypothetical protein
MVTCGNISGGKDAQLEGFAISIKFVTVERNAIPNAARKYTAAVGSNNSRKWQFHKDIITFLSL